MTDLPWPDVWLMAILLCLGESDITTDCHRMNLKSPRLGKPPTKFDLTNDLEHLKPGEQKLTAITIQWNAKIRTSDNRTTPKSEQTCVRTSRVWLSSVRLGFTLIKCQNPNVRTTMFGFQTQICV